MLDQHLSQLIADIYAGSHDDQLFDRAIRRLLALAQGRFILVSCVDLRSQGYDSVKIFGGGDGRFIDGMEEYRAERYRADPTLRHALRHPHAGSVTLRQTLADSDDAPADMTFTRWMEGQLGAVDMHVRYSPPDDDLILGMSLHAHAADGALNEEAKRVLALVFPHIENAKRLVVRPPDLSSETDARLVVDRGGRVRAASPAAHTLLAKRDGLALIDGCLRGTRSSEDRRLGALLGVAAGVAEGASGGVVAVPRPSGERPWIVRALPLPAAAGPFAGFAPAALVTPSSIRMRDRHRRRRHAGARLSRSPRRRRGWPARCWPTKATCASPPTGSASPTPPPASSLPACFRKPGSAARRNWRGC